MKPTIAIVGASTRAAAASATRAGFQPITADLFADADLRKIATTTRISPYPDGLLDWLRTMDPPAWMYTGALENHPELVDQMAWIAPLWGNPGDVLHRVRSPWELQAVLHNAGLLFPETRSNADGLPLDGSWLAKTYRGASGSGVRVWDQSGSGGEWERGRHDAKAISSKPPPLPLSHSPILCFQRRISGTPAAAVFVAANGPAMLLGVTQQIIGADSLRSHGFQYSGSIGPLPLDETTRSTIEQLGSVLADHFELVGLFGVDMILSDDGVWTIEVNPRFTASVEIVERITGVKAVELHARACMGAVPSQFTERAGASARLSLSNVSPPSTTLSAGGEDAPARAQGKAVLFAKHDVQVSESLADRWFEEALRLSWPTLADVSPAGTIIEAGRPILTVFAEGTDADEVLANLKSRVASIEREIYVNQ